MGSCSLILAVSVTHPSLCLFERKFEQAAVIRSLYVMPVGFPSLGYVLI